MTNRVLAFGRKYWNDIVWVDVRHRVIAGVITAGILGALTFAATSSFNTLRGDARPALTASEKKAPSEQELDARNQFFLPSICQGSKDVKKHYEIARELPPGSTREAELSTLVVDAVCIADENFALVVFDTMTPELKDRAAKTAASTDLWAGKITEAQRWASRLSDSNDKEWWLKSILRRSSEQRPAERTNPR